MSAPYEDEEDDDVEADIAFYDRPPEPEEYIPEEEYYEDDELDDSPDYGYADDEDYVE